MTIRTIEPVMRTDILRLTAATPVHEAVTRLVNDPYGTAAVVDASGRLVGLLTGKDCFRAALKASYYQQWEGTVSDHMSAHVEALDAATDIVAAAEVFLEKPYRNYPVTRDGDLVGILDRAGLLRAFLDLG